MSRYTNFRDPLGLLKRIGRERPPAALEGMARIALGYPASLIDRILVRREKTLLDNAPGSSHPVLLVVGAPRSGTTLTHQLLTTHCVASYFTNRNSLFVRAPLAASSLWDSFPAGSITRRSFYGLTRGWDSPNDAFHIWNRWFGEDRYTPAQLTPQAMEEIGQFFDAWRALHPMAVINKNNRNTAQMPGLSKSIAGVRFVVVHRDPVYVAQSLIEARQMVQGSTDIGWGLAARSGGDPVEDVVRQVQQIGALIENDAPTRAIHIDYEHLCEDPATVIKTIAEEASIPLRNLGDVLPMKPANTDRLGRPLLDRLRAELH
ncbi:MAG: sulfotransferase [Acidimicrobiia bacterium]|nr:sulfotransferase [Acidimicrobiia bacterium]